MQHYPPLPWDLLIVAVALILAMKIGEALCIAARSLGEKKAPPDSGRRGAFGQSGGSERDLARTVIPANSRIWEDLHAEGRTRGGENYPDQLFEATRDVFPGGRDGDDNEENRGA